MRAPWGWIGPRTRRWLDRLFWLAILGFIGYRLWPQASAALGLGAPGAMAPPVVVRTLAGEPVALADLRGKVVLVNFWATWCPPCRLEMPGFQRVYASRRARGFEVLGLSADQTGEESVRRFAAERGVTYPIAMVTGEAESAFGGVRALPTSFLIDRSGRIRHVVRGIFTEPALASAVDRLLQE